jgi:hypothetical protein
MAMHWNMSYQSWGPTKQWNVAITVDGTTGEVGGKSDLDLDCASAILWANPLTQAKEVSTTVEAAGGLWTAKGRGRIGANGGQALNIRATAKGKGKGKGTSGSATDSAAASGAGVEGTATGSGRVGGDAATGGGGVGADAGTGGGGVAGDAPTSCGGVGGGTTRGGRAGGDAATGGEAATSGRAAGGIGTHGLPPFVGADSLNSDRARSRSPPPSCA